MIYEVEDLAGQLRDYAGRIEVRPGRADELRERHDGLRSLKKKYGGTLDAVIERARELAAREDRADRLRDELAKAAERRDRALAEFATCCLALSAARQQASTTLSRALVAALGELGMAKAQFYIELATTEDPERDSPARWASLRGWRARHGARRLPHFR